MIPDAFERAVSPLDAARRSLFRLTTKSPGLTRLLARRDSRVACLASLQVVLLCALVVRAPVALFFLGPVVLGVLHLAADVRYLALHRAPSRALVRTSVVIAVAISVVRAAVTAHWLRVGTGDRLDVLLGVVWVGAAVGCAAGAKRVSSLLGGALGVAWIVLAALLVRYAHLVSLALIHGHNLVAVAAWLLVFRQRRVWAALPVALIALLTAALLAGVWLPWSAQHGGLDAFGTRADALAAWLAPGLSRAAGLAVVMTFVFLQGVHYAAWTGWIPQDDLRGEGTPTFRQSVRSLVTDFGGPVLALIALAGLALAALAVHDMRGALSWYMTLARSHAWFELAFLAHFALAGRWRRSAS